MSTPAKIQTSNLPTIVLVGRVNVGKSTLFNRLIEKDKAIVSDIPGTTRTNNEGLVLWRGKQFLLIDTGGLTYDNQIPLEKEIIQQSEMALKRADIVVFVTDAQNGVLPQERELAKRLKKLTNVPIFLVANKTDNEKIAQNINVHDWKKMSLGDPYLISAANGRSLGDFLDILFTSLNKLGVRPQNYQEEKTQLINVSIIGKPNVGKSSLFNKLIGEEKVIVSDIPHTTREPHDTLMTYQYMDEGKEAEQLINFVDTAGIRRKAKVAGELERAGIQKSLEMIEQSDIVLFVIDGTEDMSSQDKQLGGLLERHSKSVIIIVNKWDLSEDNSDERRNEVKEMVYREFPHLSFAPILLVSGLTGYRVHQIFPEIIQAWKARHTTIENADLATFLRQTVKKHLPSLGKGVRHPELLGLHQINKAPPIFELYIKAKTSVNISYVHYLENRLREQFDFFAVPIVIKLTKMKK